MAAKTSTRDTLDEQLKVRATLTATA
jgi:hypothetical protein